MLLRGGWEKEIYDQRRRVLSLNGDRPFSNTVAF